VHRPAPCPRFDGERQPQHLAGRRRPTMRKERTRPREDKEST
jgi:hypothetical protein